MRDTECSDHVTMTRSQNKFGWSPFSPVVSFHTVARVRADNKGKQNSVLDSQGDAEMLIVNLKKICGGLYMIRLLH